MRSAFLFAAFLVFGLVQARTTLRIHAPEFRERPVLLQRYLDLFTLRAEAMTTDRTDAQGMVVLDLDVIARVRVQLRIGEARTDLYLEPGANYDVIFERIKGSARSVSGAANAELTFNGLDALDINALTSDLNGLLDGFVAEDLATDQEGGMQAADEMRKGGTPAPDSTTRPSTLFVSPSLSEARVDTFARKLNTHYAGVDDPWFMGMVEYGVAGLKFGPRANEKALYDRYVKGRPVRYDDIEYIRFLRSLFEDHLLRFPFQTYEQELQRAITSGVPDSVKRVFAQHDFLSTDDRLCELVVMNELYAQYNGKLLDRHGVRSVLRELEHSSPYPEHRQIAADMVWDLSAMRPGTVLPTMKAFDLNGRSVNVDSLLKGPVLMAFTAAWCTYCEMELSALEQLYAEHGEMVTFIGIGTDPGMEAFQSYVRLHPKRNWTWLYIGDDLLTMEQLRMRSIPQFLLLQDRSLVYSPSPLPSEGLPAILHRMKVKAEEQGKIKVTDRTPPPKPPQR